MYLLHEVVSRPGTYGKALGDTGRGVDGRVGSLSEDADGGEEGDEE